MKATRAMTDGELAFARKDLNEVIAIQEAGVKVGMHCPKLGTYWDDLHAVLAEIRRRQKGA